MQDEDEGIEEDYCLWTIRHYSGVAKGGGFGGSNSP